MNNEARYKSFAGFTKDIDLALASLWDICRDAFRNYKLNLDINQAAAIAFYAILSLIPLLLLTLLAAGQFFGSHPHLQKDMGESIMTIHPFFSDELFNNIAEIRKKSHLLGGAGIISLIWLSTMIFGALDKALNGIFRAGTPRNFIKSKLLAFSMIPMGWIVGVTSIGITYLATIVKRQPILARSDILLYASSFIASHLLPFLITVIFITLVYRLIPRGKVSLRGACGGAIIFSALLELAKSFFTWYIANYTHYDVIFGSMETIVLLIIWVFYVSIILLFCGELIASYERRDLILLEEAFLKPRNKGLKIEERLFKKFGRLFPQGSYLFREGDRSRDMFYILDGEVRIEKKAGQVTKVLAEIGPGSYLGEMAPLIHAPRTASAHAVRESHVAVISEDMLSDVLRESAEVSLFMLREFSQRIKNTSAELEEVTQAWIKLLVVLYFLKEWPLKERQNPLEEIAALTGKIPAEIEEIFAWLAREGILLMQGGRVTGFDKEHIGRILQSNLH